LQNTFEEILVTGKTPFSFAKLAIASPSHLKLFSLLNRNFFHHFPADAILS